MKRKHTAIYRQPSPKQGRALEVLGHAIEYLMDSYVLTASEDGGSADTEAAQRLMQLNREVFMECAEIVPWYQRKEYGVFGIVVDFFLRLIS